MLGFAPLGFQLQDEKLPPLPDRRLQAPLERIQLAFVQRAADFDCARDTLFSMPIFVQAAARQLQGGGQFRRAVLDAVAKTQFKGLLGIEEERCRPEGIGQIVVHRIGTRCCFESSKLSETHVASALAVLTVRGQGRGRACGDKIG